MMNSRVILIYNMAAGVLATKLVKTSEATVFVLLMPEYIIPKMD